MMEERATGIILRCRPLTESSLIVHWLTADLGRIATVAKGARRHKSPFRGKLDLFFLAELTFQRSRRSDLHQLREVALLQTNPALRRELTYLRQASYVAALIEQTTEVETPLANVYALMLGFLEHLPKQAPTGLTLFAFELKLLHELGLTPGPQAGALSPGTQQIIARLSSQPWPVVQNLKLSSLQAAEIRTFLHAFLSHHLDRLPRGREAALQS